MEPPRPILPRPTSGAVLDDLEMYVSVARRLRRTERGSKFWAELWAMGGARLCYLWLLCGFKKPRDGAVEHCGHYSQNTIARIAIVEFSFGQAPAAEEHTSEHLNTYSGWRRIR